LDKDGIVEHDLSIDELYDVADAATEQHRHLRDTELVSEGQAQLVVDEMPALASLPRDRAFTTHRSRVRSYFHHLVEIDASVSECSPRPNKCGVI
jgi:hypothetical protein